MKLLTGLNPKLLPAYPKTLQIPARCLQAAGGSTEAYARVQEGVFRRKLAAVQSAFLQVMTGGKA